MKTLSEKLRAWRGVDLEKDGRGAFSQAEAARILGVSLPNYRNWEQGHRTPRGLTIEVLQERLSTNPSPTKKRRAASRRRKGTQTD